MDLDFSLSGKGPEMCTHAPIFNRARWLSTRSRHSSALTAGASRTREMHTMLLSNLYLTVLPLQLSGGPLNSRSASGDATDQPQQIGHRVGRTATGCAGEAGGLERGSSKFKLAILDCEDEALVELATWYLPCSGMLRTLRGEGVRVQL